GKAKFIPELAQLSDDKAIHPFPSGKTERSGYGWEWGSELGTMESTQTGKASPSEDSHSVYIQIFEGNPGL
ncbi:cardiolipin synthase, partial [Paenibacillus azoreducens]